MQTERQTQIIESSMELIANQGIQGFTIKNISKAIGISEPAIYRHFGSKVEILIAILDDFKQMGKMMSLMLVANDGTAIAKIEFMFSRMFDVFVEQPSIISIIFAEEIFKNELVLKNKIIEIHNMYQANVEEAIAKGQKAKDVRKDIDKSSFALIFMGSIRLLVKRWELNNMNFDLKEEGLKLLNSFRLLTVK